MNAAPEELKPRPRRLRRWLLRLALVVLSLLVVEVGFRVWLAATGAAYHASETETRLRQSLLNFQGLTFLERSRETTKRVDSGMRIVGRVPHPFFGWQTLAGRADVEQRKRAARRQSKDTYLTWIVGGSVANFFGRRDMGAQRLAQLLSEDARFEGRKVVIHNYARAAYKQPQQLNQVAYLFSLGLEPDAVINIDGFNEVAIGNMNAISGSDPIYPSISQWGAVAMPLEALPELEQKRRKLLSVRDRARRFGETVLDLGLYRSSVVGWFSKRLLGNWRDKCKNLDSNYIRALLDKGDSDILRGPTLGRKHESKWDAIVTNWVESSRSLNAMCTDRGVYYVHVLQPTLHDEGSKPLSEEELASSRVTKSWSEGARKGYPLLREASARLVESGTVFVDASDVFQGVTDTLYFDSCHFDKAGNDHLAERIAKEFLAQLP